MNAWEETFYSEKVSYVYKGVLETQLRDKPTYNSTALADIFIKKLNAKISNAQREQLADVSILAAACEYIVIAFRVGDNRVSVLFYVLQIILLGFARAATFW